MDGENPAKDLDVPDASFSPTLPVEDADFEKLVAATARYPKKGIYGEKTGERVKAFLLLLRYSGLLIGDVVRLKRENIQGNKLLIRTPKTKVNVGLRLPEFIIEALPAEDGADYFGRVSEIRSHALRIGRDRSSAWLKSRASNFMRTCSATALQSACLKRK
jgi:integrase